MDKAALTEKNKLKLITDSKIAARLGYLCMIIYFASYMTRLNYGAVVSELVATEGISKQGASFAVTGLFITYGIGQIISGWLGDRFSPKTIMFCGLIISTAMNILVPLNTNVAYLTTVWCINGFGQALMWPPIVKILSTCLAQQDYLKATVTVSWGSSLGTITIYLLAPVCIAFMGWRLLFYICAICGIVGAVVAWKAIGSVEKYSKAHGIDREEHSSCKEDVDVRSHAITGKVLALIAIIMVCIVLQGSLRDGVTTWMPSYIDETFNLGTAISILSGVIMPIFSLLCINVAKAIYFKVKSLSNEFVFAGIIFAISFFSSGFLNVFSNASPVISVVCSTIIVACMHGINLFLVCMVPVHFMKTGKVSLISGILNFATYIGAALSTYGFAAISEKTGNWSGTILLWTIISALGAVICLCVAKTWDKYKKS